MEKSKKGFMFKSLKDFDGLAIHVDTFREYLNSLPKNNGWVHFCIYDNPPGSAFPKQMIPQRDATPLEVSRYLYEQAGKDEFEHFGEWIRNHRNPVKQAEADEQY